MKIIYLLLGVLITQSSEAAVFSGFCWAQLDSGVYCSPIAASPSIIVQSIRCSNYAHDLGASKSGWFRNTNVGALEMKQSETCNYVDTLPKYECFLEERCESDTGPTSSLSPIGQSVFSTSGDSDLARKKCVTTASDFYLDALESAPLNCLVGARAVMTLPKQH